MTTPEIKLRLIGEYATSADYVVVNESGEAVDNSIEWESDGFYTGQTLLQYFSTKTQDWEDIDWYRTTEAAVKVKHYIEEKGINFNDPNWPQNVDIYKVFEKLASVAYEE